jgi:hypothetical protein
MEAGHPTAYRAEPAKPNSLIEAVRLAGLDSQ